MRSESKARRYQLIRILTVLWSEGSIVKVGGLFEGTRGFQSHQDDKRRRMRGV
jgi:hypothetical protein